MRFLSNKDLQQIENLRNLRRSFENYCEECFEQYFNEAEELNLDQVDNGLYAIGEDFAIDSDYDLFEYDYSEDDDEEEEETSYNNPNYTNYQTHTTTVNLVQSNNEVNESNDSNWYSSDKYTVEIAFELIGEKCKRITSSDELNRLKQKLRATLHNHLKELAIDTDVDEDDEVE